MPVWSQQRETYDIGDEVQQTHNTDRFKIRHDRLGDADDNLHAHSNGCRKNQNSFYQSYTRLCFGTGADYGNTQDVRQGVAEIIQTTGQQRCGTAL